MKTKTKLHTLLAMGIILALGPVWGLLGTVVGMVMAFGHMGATGMGKPEVLANDVGIALYTTAAGLIVCPIGIVCITIAVIFLMRNTKPNQQVAPAIEPPVD
jgi:biopolymer transport protein ExbB/TolQ